MGKSFKTTLFVLTCALSSGCTQGSGFKALPSPSVPKSSPTATPTPSPSPTPAPGQLTSSGPIYYISPNGNDNADGRSEATAWKSFAKAFSTMTPGGILTLLDGVYSEAAGTGFISYYGNRSAQIPSGTGAQNATWIRSKNLGNVKVMGNLFIGRTARRDRYIRIEGISFQGANLLNSDHIYIKDCGFHSESQSAGGVFSIGTNDYIAGTSTMIVNNDIVAEDIWVSGKERISIIVYRSDNVVIRRAIIRNDGCDSSSYECGSNTGNYMVGATVYNSHHVSFQNIMALDSVLGPAGYPGAADIQSAWHDNYPYPFGANEWDGCLSLNSQLTGIQPEFDDIAAFESTNEYPVVAYQPIFKIRNVVAANSARGTFNAQSPTPYTQKDILIEGVTVYNTDYYVDAFRVDPAFEFTNPNGYVRNIIAFGTGRYGINTPLQPSFADVFGNWSLRPYNEYTCKAGTNCFTSDPRNDGPIPSMKYLTRIEAGSKLKGAGYAGADIGANIVYRYGADGAFFGAPNYNTLTNVPLWPWRNEALIKKEMCTDLGITRGFCSKASITEYIWTYFGNPVPSSF